MGHGYSEVSRLFLLWEFGSKLMLEEGIRRWLVQESFGLLAQVPLAVRVHQFGIQSRFEPKKVVRHEGPEQADLRRVFPACASQVWMSYLRPS